MKRCPVCTRVYDDPNLGFCLDDGTPLVNRLPAGGPAETAAFSAADPAPTIQAGAPAVAPVRGHTPPALSKQRRRRWPWIVGSLAVLAIMVPALVALALLFRPKPPLNWHLILEVQADSADETAALVNQTVSVITNRLNAAGVPHFQIKPDRTRIALSLPAVKDPERIKQLLTTAGRLELVHVVSAPNPSLLQTYDTEQEARAFVVSSETLPDNRRVLPYEDRDPGTTGGPRKWLVVKSAAIVDGRDLRNASAVRSAYEDNYDVLFTLNSAGAARFGAWTSANINEYLGIVLNGEVKSAPYIKSQISDQGQISGRFTKQAAEDLALVLKSGALPAPLKLIEERTDK